MAKTVITQQLAHEMNDATAATPLHSNPANFYNYPGFEYDNIGRFWYIELKKNF